MELLEHLITSGRIIDIMLVFLAAETLLLVWRRQRSERGPTIAAIITNACAGGSLMLALKAILSGAGWPLVAVALLGSLLFHVSDLLMRWREAPGPVRGVIS